MTAGFARAMGGIGRPAGPVGFHRSGLDGVTTDGFTVGRAGGGPGWTGPGFDIGA